MHIPVMTKELIEFLNCRPGGIYIDATLGCGGWSEAVLDACLPDGSVIAFDRDPFATATAGKRLERFAGRVTIVEARFSEIPAELEKMGISRVDGAAADLGVSSLQLDTAERGFSFQEDARLDMRMEGKGVGAYELVNSAGEKELAKWFFEFGEERFSRRIARAITEARKKHPVETTIALAKIVAGAVPPSARRGRIHPATRVFQALRMVVNDEMGELEKLVGALPPFLKTGGRFVVASYQSLEDRMVKRSFAEWGRGGGFRRVVKKPVTPSVREIESNIRARSAKLRVLERL